LDIRTQQEECALRDLIEFLDRFSALIHEIEMKIAGAHWRLETTGSDEAKAEVVQLEVQQNALYQQEGDWDFIAGWHGRRQEIPDQSVRRQCERLYMNFAANQGDTELVEKIANLATDVGADFASYRGKIGETEHSDNDLHEVLRTSSDDVTVRTAWEAGKAIGPIVADRVVALAHSRNDLARRLGHRDFYTQQLALQEIEEPALFDLLARLDTITREPFLRLKLELDGRMASRFGLHVDDLMPWHYSNPFFQEPPPLSEQTLEPLFARKDVVKLAADTFEMVGLDVQGILESSDLFERPNKNQHAFEIQMDAMRNDARILCNVRHNEYWAGTMLHELGHAVYDRYLGEDLPFLLRSAAHISSTEAIAMLFGRLTKNPGWLEAVAGASAEDVTRLTAPVGRDLQFQMLTFVRWVLVMTHFERALYLDPDREDLNDLWWQLVSRYQLLRTPPSRPGSGEHSDWAAKIHLALYPVYYHNYVLGELTASQIQDTLISELGPKWFLSEQAGRLLKDRMFALGSTFPWNETVERATGELLTPSHFAEQFVGD
jgi:peptidyl-dipeptidase A